MHSYFFISNATNFVAMLIPALKNYRVSHPSYQERDVFQIPEVGMLRTLELPMTKHRLDSDQEFRGFGLHLIPEIPKRQWRIKYSGKMK